MSIFGRRGNQKHEETLNNIIDTMEKGGKAHRIIFNIALFALFIPIAVIVVGIVRQTITSGLTLAMSITAIIGFACILSLYWVRHLENNQYKIISWTFLGLTLFVAVIWIISACLIIALYEKAKANQNFNYASAVNFVRITLIISMQVVTANFISRMFLKYKKTYIGVQAIAYASNIYIDIWVTMLLICISISKSGFNFNWNIWNLLIGPTMLTLLILSFIYAAFINSIIKTLDQRKVTRAADKVESMTNQEIKETVKEEIKEETNSVEERLNKIKELKDKGIITQEEYEAKRADILKDM